MNPTVWEMIVGTLNVLTPLRRTEKPATLEKIDLVDLRSKIRVQMEGLHLALTEQYSEREAYYVLFPLTAHFDEIVKKNSLDSNEFEWPSLQNEFYNLDDAGDVFFELLDSALNKPETLPLVYEVYYFCLNDGFCGRYSAFPDRLSHYLLTLFKHIKLQPIVTSNPSTQATTKHLYFRVQNYVYYLGSGFLLVLFYLFLVFLGSTWEPWPN